MALYIGMQMSTDEKRICSNYIMSMKLHLNVEYPFSLTDQLMATRQEIRNCITAYEKTNSDFNIIQKIAFYPINNKEPIIVNNIYEYDCCIEKAVSNAAFDFLDFISKQYELESTDFHYVILKEIISQSNHISILK